MSVTNQCEKEKGAKAVQTLAELRLQVFRTRDLAVASVEDTIKLKNYRADDDAEVVAAHQKKASAKRQNKKRYRACVGMNGKLEQKTGYESGNGTVQKPCNNSVLQFAHVAVTFMIVISVADIVSSRA